MMTRSTNQLFLTRAASANRRVASNVFLIGLLLLGCLLWPAVAAETGAKLEDFEESYQAERWTFSNGGEFPGAKGSFGRTAEAAHEGKFGGKLSFDFTGGGNYVSALLCMPEGGAAAGEWNALQLWLKRPEGNEVFFRYTDATGQTLQKPVEFAAGPWVRVIIPFTGWTGHWGGTNDGKVHGRPRTVALNINAGQQVTGALFFDDLRLIHHEVVTARVSYPAYRFAPEEAWHLRADGNAGASRLEGKTWTLDFSQGARSLALAPPDHVLPGNVDRIRLRLSGGAKGHPVQLVLRTHFMTFQKVIGELTGEAEQELVTEGPPGTGWEWHSGENDGKIHGPLRVGEIQVLSGGHADQSVIELREVVVKGSCPDEQRCLLLADSEGAGDQASFVARLRAMSDTALPGEIHWVLRDWEGSEVEQGKAAVTVPAKTAAGEFKLPLRKSLLAGRNFLEAEFTLEIPGQEVPAVQAAWLAAPAEKGDAAPAPESPFGMGIYLNRYGGDVHGLALMAQAAKLACAAGVKWSREDFSWGRIERQRGQFDWTYYDNLLACARRNGIAVYGIVGYWTGWTKPYTAEGIEDYTRFVRALVGRYHTEVKQWEIWNEPNIFFWQGPRDMYAELLTKSYAAIKQVDPQAQVLGLSTAGIDRPFIARMLELKAPFDILTIHPYRTRLNDLVFIEDLKKVSDQVKLPDGTRRPVWLTEMGWATHTPHNTIRQDFAPTTLRAQAELIVRSYLCAIVSGVEPRTFWYDFRNDGDDPVYFEHQMGIVYQDFRPKPAYTAYATLTQMLKGRKLDGPVPAPKGVYAFRFKPIAGGLGGVIALWSPSADARVELPVTAGRVTRINAMGERTELEPAGGRVSVALKQGAAVYIRGD